MTFLTEAFKKMPPNHVFRNLLLLTGGYLAAQRIACHYGYDLKIGLDGITLTKHEPIIPVVVVGISRDESVSTKELAGADEAPSSTNSPDEGADFDYPEAD